MPDTEASFRKQPLKQINWSCVLKEISITRKHFLLKFQGPNRHLRADCLPERGKTIFRHEKVTGYDLNFFILQNSSKVLPIVITLFIASCIVTTDGIILGREEETILIRVIDEFKLDPRQR